MTKCDHLTQGRREIYWSAPFVQEKESPSLFAPSLSCLLVVSVLPAPQRRKDERERGRTSIQSQWWSSV